MLTNMWGYEDNLKLNSHSVKMIIQSFVVK